MQKITFENLPSTNTPLSASNLNTLQENVEDAIDEAGVIVSPTEPVTDRRKIWLQHGKNLFNANILPYVDKHGVTATPNGSKITLNGTNSQTTNNLYAIDYLCTLKAGTYILSATLESGTASGTYNISLRNSDGTKIENDGTSFTLTNDQPVYFRFQLASGASFSNAVFDMQLEQGATATTYEEYIEDKTFILNDNNVYEKLKEDDIEEFTLDIPSAQTGSYYQAFKKGRLATITADIRINGITGSTIINLGTVPNAMKPYLNNAVTSMIVIDGGGHPVDYGWAMVNTEGTIRIQAINTSSSVRILAFSLTYLTAEKGE